jgi:NhaP-type Na+/H+ or K+/H+ antiporter
MSQKLCLVQSATLLFAETMLGSSKRVSAFDALVWMKHEYFRESVEKSVNLRRASFWRILSIFLNARCLLKQPLIESIKLMNNPS